jgi:[ribosomal protein S18]-alanine N-acetyltransferase
MRVATEFVIEPMRLEHIPAVSAIERLSFSQPWPANAYRRELQENKAAYYIVARHLGGGIEPPMPAQPRVSVTRPTPLGESLIDRISRFLRTPSEAERSPALDETLRSIVGYAGLWQMVDEAHVTTIATHPSIRGRGAGELLLLGLIERALDIGARWMTLEVRVSNTVAQNLYRKYTFKEMGVRRRYYSDNGEDALVLWTDPLDAATFREALERNEKHMSERLGAEFRLGEHPRSLGSG